MWYTGAEGSPRSVHLRCGNLLAVVRRFTDAARVFRTGIELSPPPPPPTAAAAAEDAALAPLRARLQVNLGVVLEAQVCRGWRRMFERSARRRSPLHGSGDDADLLLAVARGAHGAGEVGGCARRVRGGTRDVPALRGGAEAAGRRAAGPARVRGGGGGASGGAGGAAGLHRGVGGPGRNAALAGRPRRRHHRAAVRRVPNARRHARALDTGARAGEGEE